MVYVLYIFLCSLQIFLYISPIIDQFFDGKLNKELVTWNIWASTTMYFRLHKSKLRCFGHWNQQGISWVKLERGSHYDPGQINTRGRGEVISHGGGKLPGSAVIPWIHDAGGARVNNGTRGNYHMKPFLSESRCGNQVAGW